jgi:hypothetical protein
MSHPCSWHRVRLAGLAFLIMLPLLAVGPGPAPADPSRDPVLDRAYEGFLSVELICSYPQFESSAQMDVHIGIYGVVTISDAAMNYGGTEPGECDYTRTGTWNIAPLGYYRAGPPQQIEVDENVDYSEHLLMVCPPPVGTVMDKTPSGTWHGGLAFDFLDAQMGGAVVEATNEFGDLVRWTLGLVPSLPVEKATWSAIKALYAD